MATICMLTNLFPPLVSGSSTQSLGLSRQLVRRGHKVIVITARVDPATPAQEQMDGVQVYRLPALRLPKMSLALNFPWLNATFWPANLKRARRIVEENGVDVLHVHNHMFDTALMGAWLRRQLGLPMVLTIHTIIKHANPAYNLLLYPLDRFFLRHATVRQADSVISPDANVEAYVRERFGRHESTLIPYGISLPGVPDPATVAEIGNRFDLAGKRVILSLGHVHALRTRLDLIQAMPAILERSPEAVLLIVGNVSDSTPVQLVGKLGLDRQVIFTGTQPHSSVSAFLRLAELEVHWLNQDEPSRTSLGIASMEAMSTGRTILAAANPDTFGPGVLRHDHNLVIVAPNRPNELAAEIVDLLNDDTRRGRIAEAARLTAENHFGWDSVTERTLQLYGVVKENLERLQAA